MQTHIQHLPKSVVKLEGSLAAEEFDAYVKRATAHMVESVELPGFRKGKAPEKMVLEKVGEAHILEEAADLALRDMYPKALESHNLDAIGRPEVRIKKLARGNPLEWEAEITVLPAITLPDYTAIAKEKNAEPKPEVAITDEELTKTIDWLRNSRKQKQEDGTEIVPELTDDFAKSLGAFTTVDELKTALTNNMHEEKTAKEHDKRKMELIAAIRSRATLEIPELLVDAEKEKMATELKASIGSMGLKWDEYLTHIKKTEDELKADWAKDAETRVAYALILREIAKHENLSPSAEELDRWADSYIAAQSEDVRAQLDRSRIKEYAYGVLRNEKVFEFLEHIRE